MVLGLVEFNLHGLSNTTWAFAALDVRQEECFGAIARRTLVRLEDVGEARERENACVAEAANVPET